MTKPNVIETLHSVAAFNRERGQATHHPLISVIDQKDSTPFFPQRYLSELFIIFLKESECEGIIYGRGEYAFYRDNLLFIAPGQVLSHHSDEQYRPQGWAIAFHPDLIAGSNINSNQFDFFCYDNNIALAVTADEKKRLLTLFAQLKDETESSTRYSPSNNLIANNSIGDQVILSYLELILRICHRLHLQTNNQTPKPNSDLLLRLEQELNFYLHSGQAQDVGLPSVQYFAEKMHLTPNYFGDVIKRETGISAKAFLEKWLTSIAKQKMADSSLNIAQIAYQLGFKHPQHFTRFFKRNVGVTPTQYR